MNHTERIRAAVYRTIGTVNELLPDEQALEVSDELALLGKNARLDSMGFVNFVVILEEELEQEVGRGIDMADLLTIQTADGGTITTVADLIEALSARLH